MIVYRRTRVQSGITAFPRTAVGVEIPAGITKTNVVAARTLLRWLENPAAVFEIIPPPACTQAGRVVVLKES